MARENIAAFSREDGDALAAEAPRLAPGIEAEDSGALVSLTDSAARDAQSLVTTITAAQAGTGAPSPDNIRLISGWDAASVFRTDKNLCSLGTVSVAAYKEHKLATPIPAGSYIFSAGITSSDTDTTQVCVVLVPTAGSVINMYMNRGDRIARTFTAAAPIKAIRFYASSSYQDATGDTAVFADIQIEQGSTATDYAPYAGMSLTTALPETVYGGSLDWTTGTLTITHVMQTYDGTEDWTYGSANSVCSLKDLPDGALVDNQSAYHKCSHYKPLRYRAGDVQTDKTCYTLNTTTLMVKDTSLTSLEDWTGYLAAQAAAGTPMTIVWALKEARYETIQLTPQQLTLLKGENHVWSDTGDTSVAYIADTKLYIDNAIATLTAAIAGI